MAIKREMKPSLNNESLKRLVDVYLDNNQPLALILENYNLKYEQYKIIEDCINDDMKFDRYKSGFIETDNFIIENTTGSRLHFTNAEINALFKEIDRIKKDIEHIAGSSEEIVKKMEDLEERLSRCSISQQNISDIQNFLGEYKTLDPKSMVDSEIVNKLLAKYNIPFKDVRQLNDLYMLYMSLYQEKDNLRIELDNKDNQIYELNGKKERLRDQLIVSNLSVVNWVVLNFFNSIELDFEEAQAYGLLGLTKAINGYDISTKKQFLHYAIPVIVHNIQLNFDKLYGMTWDKFVKRERIKNARNELRKQGITKFINSEELELSGLTGLTKNQIDRADDFQIDVVDSLDRVFEVNEEEFANGKNPTNFEEYEKLDKLEDHFEDIKELDILDRCLIEYDNQQIIALVDTLPDRRRDVIKKYYGLDGNKRMTYAEIALEYRVSESRIEQVLKRALVDLRRKGEVKKLIHKRTESPKVDDFEEKLKKLMNLREFDFDAETKLKFINMNFGSWDMEMLEKAEQLLDYLKEEVDNALGYSYETSFDLSWRIVCKVRDICRFNISTEFVCYFVKDYLKKTGKEIQTLK